MVESKVATGVDAPKERTARNYCPPELIRGHHWNIGPPNGRTSVGTCRGCGATQQFRNSTEYVPRSERNSNNGNSAGNNSDGADGEFTVKPGFRNLGVRSGARMSKNLINEE